MNNILFSIVIIFSLCACSSSQPIAKDNTHGITWRLLSHAKEEALVTNKPMLVDFFTKKDCQRCQILIRDIYSNELIAARIKRDFIPVRVDIDNPLSAEEKILAELLESGEECILAFLTPHGSIITEKDENEEKKLCSMAVLTQDSFINYLDKALKNLNEFDR